jgi:hypothetical protein
MQKVAIRKVNIYWDTHPDEGIAGNDDMEKTLGQTHQDVITPADLDIDPDIFYSGAYFNGKGDKMGTQRTIFSLNNYYVFLLDRAISCCFITGLNTGEISNAIVRGCLIAGAAICTRKYDKEGDIIKNIVAIGKKDKPNTSISAIRQLMQTIDLTRPESVKHVRKISKRYSFSRYSATLWGELGTTEARPISTGDKRVQIPANITKVFEALLENPLNPKAFSLKMDGTKEEKCTKKDLQVTTRYHALFKRYEQHVRPGGARSDIHRMFFVVGLYAFGYMLLTGNIDYDELAAGRIVSSLIDFGSNTR